MADEERLRDEQRRIDDELPQYEQKYRRYLLGLSPIKESAQIEQGIFGDQHAVLEVIEDELIEDYVTGELNDSDRSRFEERFLLSQERVEKIRISALLLGRADVVHDLDRRVARVQRKMALEGPGTDEFGAGATQDDLLKAIVESGSQSLAGTFDRPSEALFDPEAQERIRELLTQLPERDRRLLQEVFREERDKDEVCREFDVDPKYLRMLVFRVQLASSPQHFSSSTPDTGQNSSAPDVTGSFTIEPLSAPRRNVQPPRPDDSRRIGIRTWLSMGAAALVMIVAGVYSTRSSPPFASLPMKNANLVPYVASAEIAEESPQPRHRYAPHPGYRSYVVTLKGVGFQQSSVVWYNGKPMFTEFVSPSELVAHTEDLSGSDYEKLRSDEVIVVNPAPNGGKSPPARISVKATP